VHEHDSWRCVSKHLPLMMLLWGWGWQWQWQSQCWQWLYQEVVVKEVAAVARLAVAVVARTH